MGQHKRAIVVTFIYEKLIVVIPALVSSVIIGNLLATFITNHLFRTGLMNHFNNESSRLGFSSENTLQMLIGVSSQQLEMNELLEMFQIHLDFQTVMLFLLFSFTIIIVTTSVAACIIMTQKPKENLG